jgi:hypothetical protein
MGHSHEALFIRFIYADDRHTCTDSGNLERLLILNTEVLFVARYQLQQLQQLH